MEERQLPRRDVITREMRLEHAAFQLLFSAHARDLNAAMVAKKASEIFPEHPISGPTAYRLWGDSSLVQRNLLEVHFREMRTRVKHARYHAASLPRAKRARLLSEHLVALGAPQPLQVAHFSLCALHALVHSNQREAWEKEFVALIAAAMEIPEDQALIAFELAYSYFCFHAERNPDPGRDGTHLRRIIQRVLSAFTRKR